MGIQFFKKSVFDLSNDLPTVTVTDATATNTGQNFTDFMRNRNNTSGWATTGSNDAANTTLVINFNDLKQFSKLLLLGHNLKAFTIKYWNGSSWTDFSTAINETTNTATSNYYTFDLIETRQIQIIITGTQVADADKFIRQILMCEFIGEFDFQPELRVQFSKRRRVSPFLSGKNFVSSQVGGFSFTAQHPSVSLEADFTIIETLFDAFEGFHVSLSGGDTSQYDIIRPGYRLEDVFFMNLANEYEPSYLNGRYKNGIPINLSFVEVN